MDLRISKASQKSLANDSDFEYQKKIYRLEEQLEKMDEKYNHQRQEIAKMKDTLGLIQTQNRLKPSSECDVKNKRSQSVEGRGANQYSSGYSEKYENAVKKSKLKNNHEKSSTNEQAIGQAYQLSAFTQEKDRLNVSSILETLEFRFQEFDQQQKAQNLTLEKEMNSKISSLMEELQDVVSTEDFQRKCQHFERQIQLLRSNQPHDGGSAGNSTQSVKGYLLTQEKIREPKEDTKSVNLSTLFHKTQNTHNSQGTLNSPSGSMVPLHDDLSLGSFNTIGLKHSKVPVSANQESNRIPEENVSEALAALASTCSDSRCRIDEVSRRVEALTGQFKTLKKILKDIVGKAQVTDSPAINLNHTHNSASLA